MKQTSFQNNVRQTDGQTTWHTIIQRRKNFAQDVRISIRGYGSRVSIWYQGHKKYIRMGLPLTSPDGTSQLDENLCFLILSLWISSGRDLLRDWAMPEVGALSFRLNDYFDGVQLLSRVKHTWCV
jgi:hypothetical protein